MKEELFSKLVEYLGNLEVVAREQIPDVLNQLLLKGIIIDSVIIVTSILSIINLIVIIKLKNKEFENYNSELLYVVYVVLSILLGVYAIVAMPIGIVDLLTIIFTPKAYLLGMLK